MVPLKYKIIKTEKQYQDYCSVLESLLIKNKSFEADEIDLLTFLIEKWDNDHNTFHELNPIELLHELMRENGIKAKDLTGILNISKGLVSDILNYKKGLSKEVIRTLAKHFSISQEAFNRPYKLNNPANLHLRNASVMNITKILQKAI
jgi:HTH-type transcriptional regulator/antitoxin HigA